MNHDEVTLNLFAIIKGIPMRVRAFLLLSVIFLLVGSLTFCYKFNEVSQTTRRITELNKSINELSADIASIKLKLDQTKRKDSLFLFSMRINYALEVQSSDRLNDAVIKRAISSLDSTIRKRQ
jgi:hypothetical protein